MVTTELITTIEFESPTAGKQREVICLFFFFPLDLDLIVQLNEHMKLVMLVLQSSLSLKQCCG